LKEGLDSPGNKDLDTDRKFFGADQHLATGLDTKRSSKPGNKIDFDDDQVV